MKTQILTLMILASSLLSCSRSDDTPAPTVYPEENPLSAYLTNSGFSQKFANSINAGNYEFGLKFTPSVKGKINAITVKIPDNATNVRVTIWDATAKTVLRTETIPTVTANTEVKQSITALQLAKDTPYMITFNSNDWYLRSKTDGTATTYPVTAGNIKVNGYYWISGTTQAFPTTYESTYYAGDLSFVFQQND